MTQLILPTIRWRSQSLRYAGYRNAVGAMLACGLFAALPGCISLLPPSTENPDVIASAINVTPFPVTITISGVADGTADVVPVDVDSLGSEDVAFACLDELVVGDPLEPTLAGAVVHTDTGDVELEPFLLRVDSEFYCGEIVELIISGDNADNFRIDVFAFTPPDL